jgi:multidrug efflux pump subunit AcrA (membrane-fusion protein)
MFLKLRGYIISHKIVSILIIVVVIFGGYFWYKNSQSGSTVTKYVIEKATDGTITSSVSGSGQTQVVTQVDVKPQVSEIVKSVSVKVGDHVNAGQLLVTLDSTNEQKSLTQAELSLKSSQLSLSKLQEPPTDVSLGQDQNALIQAQENLQTASTTLQSDYQVGLNTIGTTFVDFQNVMVELQSFVFGNDISKTQNDPDAYISLMPNFLQSQVSLYKDRVYSSYNLALSAYTKNLSDYHSISRFSDEAMLDTLFTETYGTAQLINQAVTSVKSMLDFMVNNYPKYVGAISLPSITNTLQSNFGNYVNSTDNDISNVSSLIQNVKNDKTSINNYILSLNQASNTLSELLAGADPLDIQSSQLSIEQAQINVQNAQQQVDYCYIKAPISGTVSAVNAVTGDTVASPAISIIGNSQVAEITLNEVDAIKVKVGDPATLTFDAISNLSLAGRVIEIDPVGTVSQGVVSYNVQISFTDSTNQVKPGMSVNATIITDVHQNAISVPNSAIKTQGSTSYILVPAENVSDILINESAINGIALSETPKEIKIMLGLTNNSVSEITSGLQVGDLFIVKSITTTGVATSATTKTSSALNMRSLGGVMGGAGR